MKCPEFMHQTDRSVACRMKSFELFSKSAPCSFAMFNLHHEASLGSAFGIGWLVMQ